MTATLAVAGILGVVLLLEELAVELLDFLLEMLRRLKSLDMGDDGCEAEMSWTWWNRVSEEGRRRQSWV